MGGGIGQKDNMAHENNLEKQMASNKGSQLETNKKATNIQCKVCMQTFMCTTSEVKCMQSIPSLMYRLLPSSQEMKRFL
ncbi:hypothetical protein UlMin_023606 [Ulmus minor]